MTDYLLVPVRVEALFLPENRAVTEASADFTRLPYCTGQQDINEHIAYLSEEIVSTPFQNQNLYLRAGVHLHWLLPAALTEELAPEKYDGTTKSTFPAVPNRWLVARLPVPGIPPKQWVVESDYLHPQGQGEGCVAYPVQPNGSEAPYRRMGRAMSMEAWLHMQRPQIGEHLDTLTALGYGEFTFAALYPNCHSVFGFYDPEITGNYPDGLQYVVIGWYGNAPKDDFLRKYRATKRLDTWDGLVNALKRDYDWELPGEKRRELPQRLFCCGAVNRPVDDFQGNADRIAVANSGVEALSAYLAHDVSKGDPARKARIEEQLEFLSIQPKIASHQLDLDAKYREGRHERGFNAVFGGTRWMVRQESRPAAASGAEALKSDLPQEIAFLLDSLNSQQRKVDRTQQEVTDLQRQLFSDWYKYMLCVYPPEGTGTDYPDIDEVKYFIEQQDLKLLEIRLLALKGRMTERDEWKTKLENAVRRHNQIAGNARYVVEEVPASRYWEPKEPVVLIADDAGSSLVQSRLEPVRCAIGSDIGAEAPLTKADLLDRLLKTVTNLFPASSTQPWHSVYLEWQVQYFPVQDGSNADLSSKNYEKGWNRDFDPGYILKNYSLEKNSVELTRVPKKKIRKGAQIYSGYSILTPYAGLELEEKIVTFLRESPAFQDQYQKWREAQPEPLPEPDDFAQRLKGSLDSLIAWFEHELAVQGDAPHPLVTFLLAYRALQNRIFLSQALSGLNDALLMHKQTMQLPVADPLGFPAYQAFAQRVEKAIEGENRTAPQPLDEFNPIRAGAMNIARLRLIDTFGRVKELYPGKKRKDHQVVAAEPIQPQQGENYHVMLPPRLVQPAQLYFRWMDGQPSTPALIETNAHLDTSPICGWLLPNHLDRSVMVYDRAGAPLGSLKAAPSARDPSALWHPAPGRKRMEIQGIANSYLRQVVLSAVAQGNASLEIFLARLGNALDTIAPENYHQDIGMAILIGRPLAVVRASLSLEMFGQPAVHHGWKIFRRDLRRNERDSNAFEKVKFPIRLGEISQLDDGLVCYWLEDSKGGLSKPIYCDEQNFLLQGQSIADPPLNLLLLMDPRAKIHATCGILPSKSIDIPAQYYSDVLKRLEVTFLSAPVLTGAEGMHLPVPSEPGYRWKWIEYQGNSWSEEDIRLPESQAAFAARQEIHEGWLKLMPADAPSESKPED